MDRVLAVVVSYKPSPDLVENVKILLEQVPFVVVVDNETSESSGKILSQFSKTNVLVIFNDLNLGVATGFNQGIKWGLEFGYDYFLLMDQDSRPQERMVERLLEVVKSFGNKNQRVLVGPHHEDYERKIDNRPAQEITFTPLLITSGSLMSRELIKEVGLYDDRLFIDHVDHDYCLRVIKNGGLTLKVKSATLLHRFGAGEVKTILGKSFFLQDYSVFRRYYMMRNRIVLYKRYGMFKGDWFWLDANAAIKDIVKLICFENKKKEKLAAVIRGFIDGILWSDSK